MANLCYEHALKSVNVFQDGSQRACITKYVNVFLKYSFFEAKWGVNLLKTGELFVPARGWDKLGTKPVGSGGLRLAGIRQSQYSRTPEMIGTSENIGAWVVTATKRMQQ